MALLALCGACEGNARNFAFVLDAGAFPPASYPSVVVVVPSGFRVTKPLPVVIWLHGLGNCAANVVRDKDGECTPDAGARTSFQLATHLEASGRNALLIVPQLTFDSGSDDPGNLAAPGGLRALLTETLADLQAALGPITVDDLDPIIVAAHSAAWRTSSAILQAGDVRVTELWELDSLFDGIPQFVAWIQTDLPSFVGVPPKRRFATVYTDLTDTNSINMAETAEIDWLPDAGAVLDDRGTGDLPAGKLRIGLVFKHSDLEHSELARVWFEPLLVTSRLPPR
jgi:hypothetical protein